MLPKGVCNPLLLKPNPRTLTSSFPSLSPIPVFKLGSMLATNPRGVPLKICNSALPSAALAKAPAFPLVGSQFAPA